MAKFKKENWRGQEALSKIAVASSFAIAILINPLIMLVADSTTVGVFVILVIGIYFMGLAYMSKSFAHNISLEFGGIRRWKTRYDLGRGRTGNLKVFIADHYPLAKAPKVLREKVAKTEKIMAEVEQNVRKIERGELKIDELRLLEESKSKKAQAIKELGEQDITEKTKGEYILDKVLQPYYEKETKKEAFIKGNPTKAFIEWKNSDGKVLKILKKEIRTQLIELNKKQSQKDLKERRIRLIGEEIALRATLNEIIAADRGEAEGGAVHGFLITHFEDYNDLINKDQILDIAQGIAKEIWIPKFVKVIGEMIVDQCIKTVVLLYEEALFDHEPHLPFKTMVVYAQEDFLDAVDWKERVPKTIHFYPDIPVTNGYSNIIVPTRITHDIPMVFIAHSSGKDYLVRNLQIDEEKIKEEKEELKEDMIADKNAEIIEAKEKAKAHEKKEEIYRKITARTLQEMDIVHEKLIEEKLKRLKEKEILGKTKIGKALLYFVIVVVVIFFIIVLINMSGGIPEMTNSTSTSLSVIPYNLNNIKCFGG